MILKRNKKTNTGHRWFNHVIKKSDDRLVEIYVNHLKAKTPFNPIADVLTWLKEEEFYGAANIIARLEKIERLALLESQQ